MLRVPLRDSKLWCDTHTLSLLFSELKSKLRRLYFLYSKTPIYREVCEKETAAVNRGEWGHTVWVQGK